MRRTLRTTHGTTATNAATQAEFKVQAADNEATDSERYAQRAALAESAPTPAALLDVGSLFVGITKGFDAVKNWHQNSLPVAELLSVSGTTSRPGTVVNVGTPGNP